MTGIFLFRPRRDTSPLVVTGVGGVVVVVVAVLAPRPRLAEVRGVVAFVVVVVVVAGGGVCGVSFVVDGTSRRPASSCSRKFR
jgi:hypothetical protein